MPIWYTHNIQNIDKSDLVTIFWVNEHYEDNDSDTLLIIFASNGRGNTKIPSFNFYNLFLLDKFPIISPLEPEKIPYLLPAFVVIGGRFSSILSSVNDIVFDSA